MKDKERLKDRSSLKETRHVVMNSMYELQVESGPEKDISETTGKI